MHIEYSTDASIGILHDTVKHVLLGTVPEQAQSASVLVKNKMNKGFGKSFGSLSQRLLDRSVFEWIMFCALVHYVCTNIKAAVPLATKPVC